MKFTYNLEKKEAHTKARLGSFIYNDQKYETLTIHKLKEDK